MAGHSLGSDPADALLLQVLRVTLWHNSQIRFAILDEADRMLSDGFEEDVERILATSPPDRQTLLFRCGTLLRCQRLLCIASSPSGRHWLSQVLCWVRLQIGHVLSNTPCIGWPALGSTLQEDTLEQCSTMLMCLSVQRDDADVGEEAEPAVPAAAADGGPGRRRGGRQDGGDHQVSAHSSTMSLLRLRGHHVLREPWQSSLLSRQTSDCIACETCCA